MFNETNNDKIKTLKQNEAFVPIFTLMTFLSFAA